MLPDGSINPGEMTSFNHYALGAVADWLHRTVAGLAPAAPGYREIVVRPVPGGGLTAASAEHETPYGRAAVAWRLEDGRFRLEIDVPVGVRAIVHLPGADSVLVRAHGRHVWDTPRPAPEVPPLTTVRDALDDVRVWTAVAAPAVDAGTATDPADVARRLARHLDEPAAALPRAIVPPGTDPDRAATISDVIEQILSGLAQGTTPEHPTDGRASAG